MPAKRFPISAEAIAAAARFVSQGARAYTRAGEPRHPSLRQVVAHLVARGLVEGIAPATLARALKRAGVALPPHWRNRLPGQAPKKQVGRRPTLCSSVDDGGPARTRRQPQPPLDHPWRPPRSGREHLPGRLLGTMGGIP